MEALVQRAEHALLAGAVLGAREDLADNAEHLRPGVVVPGSGNSARSLLEVYLRFVIRSVLEPQRIFLRFLCVLSLHYRVHSLK